MKQIDLSDNAYETHAAHHGDVTDFVERLAAEAIKVAAIQEGIDAYNVGDFRSLEDFGKELKERFDVNSFGT